MRIIQTKTLLWITIVYILSFICYFPMMLDQFGVMLPVNMLYLKYLFIFIPSIITVLLLVCEHNLITYFIQLFSKRITVKSFSVCFIFLIIGISVSYFYSIGAGVNLFKNTYPSIASLIISCVYLTITGFIEELAWRGFLLERVSAGRKSFGAVIFVGVIWALWHIPMWAIRNSLNFSEIVPLFIWTILVSIVLGIIYYQCRNMFVITLLHMIFNICFLAPILYNIIILAIVIIAWVINMKCKGL